MASVQCWALVVGTVIVLFSGRGDSSAACGQLSGLNDFAMEHQPHAWAIPVISGTALINPSSLRARPGSSVSVLVCWGWTGWCRWIAPHSWPSTFLSLSPALALVCPYICPADRREWLGQCCKWRVYLQDDTKWWNRNNYSVHRKMKITIKQ